jgi:hypothetical protein
MILLVLCAEERLLVGREAESLWAVHILDLSSLERACGGVIAIEPGPDMLPMRCICNATVLVSARFCSSLLVPARPCSSLLVPARPCSSLLVPARPCSSLLVPARLYQPNPTPIRETCIDALVPVPPYFFTMRCHTALGNTFSAVSCSTFLSAARG